MPLIGSVLTCGRAGAAGGLGPGTELNRYNFDLVQFPDALCNDGTPAFFYYRPASLPGSANRWVIQLQGGGSCDDGADCANRWCSVGTNFGWQGMSANPAPRQINGNGILERRPGNPMQSWNQVFVKYCSSDGWSGTRRDVVVNAPDPIDGGPREFRMHLLGARIVDATLTRLRSPNRLVYTAADGGTAMVPNLDTADVVLLAGASGGGLGTIYNLDRVRDELRRTNVNCQGGACPLVVRGLIDSIFIPSLEPLDFSTSTFCDAGLCSYRALRDSSATRGQGAFWGLRGDDSCTSWHTANAPVSASSCTDAAHVIRHHLSTPFFVRQGQNDSLLSQIVVGFNLTVPDAGVMTPTQYAALKRNELRALATIKATAEEGSSIGVLPGFFGPTCPRHETISDTPATFLTTIDAGVGVQLFDLTTAWFADAGSTTAVAETAADNFCPP